MTELDSSESRPETPADDSGFCAAEGRPAEPQHPKRRKTPERTKPDEELELRIKALQAECRQAESDKRTMEKRKNSIHASYCILLALFILAALIIVPKLQRRSYLKGYAEGVRQHAQTEEQRSQTPGGTTKTEESAEPSAELTPIPETDPITAVYIGNKNRKKFHLPSCTGLPAEKNRVYFYSREEAIEEGYTPCGICNP